MYQAIGSTKYKKYWEDQASFMDTEPWDNTKVLKLTFSKDFETSIDELDFPNHSLTKKNGELILKVKVPYNYYQLDNFELKAIELLGVEENWLNSFTIQDSYCTHNINNQKIAI